MTDKKKAKFLSKTVKFGTKSVTLYSIDGTTWSTRRDELQGIMERHEAERLKLLANMGEAKEQEAAEQSKESVTAKQTQHDDAPVIMGDEAETDTAAAEADEADEVDETDEPMADESDEGEKPALKKAPLQKPKAKKPSKKGKEKVHFVTPKPRQLEKKKLRGAKKKKAAA